MLSLIPISDANPTRRFPVMTLILIALNVVAFFQTPGLGQSAESSAYFFENAPIVCQLTDTCPAGTIPVGPDVETSIPERDLVSFLVSVVFSTFLHAGWLHIIGNMLFLWVFGNNIEDYLGRMKFVLFYLLGGLAASFSHIAWTMFNSSDTCTNADFAACIPSVGASGAVAAVMGSYMLLYPRARINVLVPIFFFITMVQMSALAVLAIWFAYQFFIAYQDIAGITEVAWAAHVGGFVFGLIAIFLLGGRPHRPPPVLQPQWRY
ncbi:MAG: rhomboid family intramembrane serine protease [Actinomycetota bacterium]|nr:rhomboid family intramembrane serine protease [Actinomycetota bacterium]